MHIGKNNTRQRYNLEENELAIVETEKDLGVTFSELLGWSEQGAAILRVASLRVASLRVASLRVASLQVASLRVASLRVASLRVASCESAS